MPESPQDGQRACHTGGAECSQNPANAMRLLLSRDCCSHDSHHAEACTPSPSRSRSPSPWSNDDRHRSLSPSDRSNASGSLVDNYATWMEPMKPPARDLVRCKSKRAKPPHKHKHASRGSSSGHIPCKKSATYDDEVDGNHYAVDVRDEFNPLDML